MHRKRYALLDEIRGITLISMILYHMTWDLVWLYGWNIPWYRTSVGYVWQQSICWNFILISGFCFPMGRHKLKRGLTVLAAGLLVTAVTCIFMWQERVIFGVLTCLGSCMLVMVPLENILNKVKPYVGIMVSIMLFLLCRNVNCGGLGFEEFQIAILSDRLYQNLFTTYIGFPPADFFSTDYFSLIPWLFLFCTGYYLHNLAEMLDGFLWIEKRKSWKVAEWMGRHSLWIYLVHQPAIVMILSLLL